jgi:hypothetical protein
MIERYERVRQRLNRADGEPAVRGGRDVNLYPLAQPDDQFVHFGTVRIDRGANWPVEVTPDGLAGEQTIGAGGPDVLALTSPGRFDSGLGLVLPGPGPRPKGLPAALFSPRANGTFTNTTERFAYGAATGKLDYDADGNGAGSSRQLVAGLINHANLTRADLFFVS